MNRDRISAGWSAGEGRMTGTCKGKAVRRATTKAMRLRRDGQSRKTIRIDWSPRARP